MNIESLDTVEQALWELGRELGQNTDPVLSDIMRVFDATLERAFTRLDQLNQPPLFVFKGDERAFFAAVMKSVVGGKFVPESMQLTGKQLMDGMRLLTDEESIRHFVRGSVSNMGEHTRQNILYFINGGAVEDTQALWYAALNELVDDQASE